MFESTDEHSVFENEDEFGVDSFRQDVRHVLNANLVTVKLHKHNSDSEKYVQGDFLGIRTKTFEEKTCLIQINMMSQAPEKQIMKRRGFDGSGTIEFECFGAHDLEIDNKDVIEFIEDYGHNVKAGHKFKIELEDRGLYQGQYSYINFRIVKIS